MTSRVGTLGVDVGTQGVRAILLAESGRVLARGSGSLPPGYRNGDRHEQTPEDWFTALITAVRQCVETADQDVVVEALALDATSGTIVVTDATGRAVGPALMYDDSRAAAYVSAVQQAGAPLWAELGLTIQASWALPKILWLLENDAVPAGGRIAHQSDYLLGRLIGHPVGTDTSSALKTGVDSIHACWPVDIFAALGLPVSVLPDLVVPGTELGRLSASAAAIIGLPAATPIRAGMTDGCAAQIAVGALAPGRWSSALGTTLVIKGATDQIVRDPTGAVYCHRNPDGGWLPGGASSIGAGAVRASFGNLDAAAFAALTQDARNLPVPAEPTYPLLGRGERFPFIAANAVGFGPQATGPALFSAVCHGIAFVERLAYDCLAVAGADVSGPIALTGGPTANHWWNQLRTDVLNRTTLLPESAEAATGMAILAAAPPGALTETATRMVRFKSTLEPDPAAFAGLQAGYGRLLSALTERGWIDADLARTVLTAAGRE